MRTAMKWQLTASLLLATSGPASAYTAYVSNERDNTISVVDLDQMKTVKTVPVGQRPRGITLTKDGKELLVCASDDDTIQIIDTDTLRVVGNLPSGPDPETFALHVSGNPLYVSNEDDNMVTVIDVPTRKAIAEIPTGVEPEGMAVSPDGQTIVNTSETTNMAHFLDYDTRKMVAAVLVDARPRVAMFKHDGSEVWVSSELGGTVSVIDPVKHVVTHKISFEVQGLRAEAPQPDRQGHAGHEHRRAGPRRVPQQGADTDARERDQRQREQRLARATSFAGEVAARQRQRQHRAEDGRRGARLDPLRADERAQHREQGQRGFAQRAHQDFGHGRTCSKNGRRRSPMSRFSPRTDAGLTRHAGTGGRSLICTELALGVCTNLRRIRTGKRLQRHHNGLDPQREAAAVCPNGDNP